MKRDPALALILAWIFPGLGHLYLGRRGKAAFFAASLLGLFLLGYALADFRFVRFEDNPFYFVGRWGSGATWLLTNFLIPRAPAGVVPVEIYEPGLLYMCAAGLLNVVLVLNVLNGFSRGEDDVKQPAAESNPPPPAA